MLLIFLILPVIPGLWPQVCLQGPKKTCFAWPGLVLNASTDVSCRFIFEQGPGELGDYLCGTSHVSDVNLQECLGTSEEILVRKYTGATHTYVITAMFPFDSVLDYFCPVLQVNPTTALLKL